jgi:hypothetical protein
MMALFRAVKAETIVIHAGPEVFVTSTKLLREENDPDCLRIQTKTKCCCKKIKKHKFWNEMANGLPITAPAQQVD